MQTGRPTKTKRSEFGARLHAARETAGLSQAQVAAKLGIHQSSYADWERYPVALRPEQLSQLASILGIATEQLLGNSDSKRRGGPAGKARQMFERVSQLPRATQQRILANVQDSLTAYEARRAS